MDSTSEVADTNPNPKPALRTSSTKRPPFGSNGKSLSFEEKCTVIPDSAVFDLADFDSDENSGKCTSVVEKLEWWDPDSRRNWVQYCHNTSIHGLKYVGEPHRHIVERVFWILSFALSCLAAMYLVNSLWIKYIESPVVITLQPEETFVEQIPFPAVTICNMNKVLKSKAEEYMQEAVRQDKDNQDALRNVYYLDHVCSTSNKPFSTIFNYTSTQGTVNASLMELVSSKIKPEEEGVADVAEFLMKASQPCTGLLKLCLWEGKVYNCQELFRPIETNFGKCCTFNMVPQSLLHHFRSDSRDSEQDVKAWGKWNPFENLVYPPGIQQEDKLERPRRQNRAGKVSGLAFLVDPDMKEYFCTSSDSTGFKLMTHFSSDTPHVTDFGLAIRPNSEHFVSVRPEITLADDGIRNIPLKKRNCYMDGEYRLKYYDYYTSGNCFDECIANETYRRCGCVRYYMPRDNKRAICGPSKFACAEDIKRESFVRGLKSSCKYCLPSCSEIRYHPVATSTPFRRRFDLWANELNQSTSWAKNNISIIHVYFGQDSTYARVRSQLYGLTDFIAQFGGLIGLCMGFSGLSLVEFIYFFTLRVWYRRQRKLKHRREEEHKRALERDREKALQYLGVGRTPSRRNSLDSNQSYNEALNSIYPNPKIERDKDSIITSSSGYNSALGMPYVNPDPNGHGKQDIGNQ